MLEKFLKSAFGVLSSPIRYSIRFELSKQTDFIIQNIRRDSKDIRSALQRRATESTSEYVEKHIKNIDSVSSKIELLAIAIEKADLNKKLVCEFGVYSGKSINHIASLTNQTVYGFDSFEGLPERWRDGFGKGHFKKTKLPKVQPNVVLIKGWFDMTLPAFVKDHNEFIGFLHIDCDLYSSTKTIFDLLEHQIHPGCIIVFDDYFNYPGWEEGEYKAFHEFLERAGLEYDYICFNSLSTQVAVKIKGR